MSTLEQEIRASSARSTEKLAMIVEIVRQFEKHAGRVTSLELTWIRMPSDTALLPTLKMTLSS